MKYTLKSTDHRISLIWVALYPKRMYISRQTF